MEGHGQQIAFALREGLPQASFLSLDVRAGLARLEKIDVLFYRRDSAGEGGSGVFILETPFFQSSWAAFRRVAVT